MTTRFGIGDGAALDWQPEPLVSVRGSDHLIDTTVSLSSSARLRLVDELVLGRTGEAPGRIRLRCRVTRDGVAVLAHDLDVGCGSPGWDSAAVMGNARAFISVLHIGPDAPTTATLLSNPEEGSRAAWMPLAPDAALLLALAPTLLAARRTARSVGVLPLYGATASAVRKPVGR
jgi:urease accessory protein